MRHLITILSLIPVLGFGQQKILRAKPVHQRSFQLVLTPNGSIQLDSVFYLGFIRGESPKYIGVIVPNATDEELFNLIKPKRSGYYRKGKEIFIIE